MKKWEYLIQRMLYDQYDLEQQLCKLGEDGWELVGIANVQIDSSTTRQNLILFFKQEVSEPPPTARRNEIFDPGFSGQAPKPQTTEQAAKQDELFVDLDEAGDPFSDINPA